MNLGHSLKLELSQKLIMTPELRQAIAILQMSALELSDVITEEIIENPVLEVMESDGDEVGSLEPSECLEKFGKNEQWDDYFNWVDYFNNGMEKRSEYMTNDEMKKFEVFVKNNVSLHEHLEMQLYLALRDETAKKVGNYLIGFIDDNGYLQGTISEAATALGISEEIVADVLALIQTFDPLGVGARDLQECLILQFEQKGIQNDLVKAIINGYLPEVAAARYKAIAEKLSCNPQKVQQAVDIIRTFDPKPGRAFAKGQPAYITPDITVERVQDKYMIIVNDTNTPRLTINPYYRQMVVNADHDSKNFIEKKINSAVWLMKSIEQRRRTLYNVMEAIVRLQQDFFDNGSKFLRPLTMKQVAEQIGVHESTVSRAIANKYVDTPYGLVNLRNFFPTAVHNNTGIQDVSATKAKHSIKELIAGENPSEPFSDQAVAEILCQQGIKISRRTVTKYREELGIVSSTRRKRY